MRPPHIEAGLLGDLGRAGYVIVPKECVPPALIDRALKVRPKFPEPDLLLSVIRQATVERFDMKLDTLLEQRRMGPQVKARQVAMYVACQRFGQGRLSVANALERSDLTTITHGVRRIETLLADPAKGPRLLDEINWIEARANVLISGRGR